MAAVKCSPIVGSAVGFDRGVVATKCSTSRLPRTVSLLDHSLNCGKHQQCRSPSLGALGRAAAATRKQQRRAGVVVRAAEEESFFKDIGAQLFNARGKGADSDDKSSGSTKLSAVGGGKKKAQKEEVPEKGKGGTQLFNFGTKKIAKGDDNAANGSVRKEGTLPFGRGRRVDPKTVFVAGSTGQIGARISQQLLRAGFNVRGGVPDLVVAQQLAEFATQYGVLTKEEAKRLNAVEFSFKDVGSIAKAIGNAGKVVITVGPTEDGPKRRVSRDDALRVVEAAAISNVTNLVLVTEPGSGVSASAGPLAGIAAIFGSLFNISSRQVSESDLISKIVETDLQYTVINAGSTADIDDLSPESGNVVIETEGSAGSSATVSKLQVAKVVAGAFGNTGISENKCFDVSSSPSAPSRPVDELLSAISVDGRRQILAEERAVLEAKEKEMELRSIAQAEAQEAVEEARKAAKLAAELEAEAKKLAAAEVKAASAAAKAQARADAAAASVNGLQEKAKELIGGPLKTISGRLGAVSFKLEDRFKKAAVSSPKPSPPPSKKQQRPPSESEGPQALAFFGNLLAPQETIYVDED